MESLLVPQAEAELPTLVVGPPSLAFSGPMALADRMLGPLERVLLREGGHAATHETSEAPPLRIFQSGSILRSPTMTRS